MAQEHHRRPHALTLASSRCLLQAPEEVLGYSYGELGSMSSPSFSDQEMLELVDAQHMMKLLSNGARKGILLWRWEDC